MEWNNAIELPNNWYNHSKLEELYGVVRNHILKDLEKQTRGKFLYDKRPSYFINFTFLY